MELEELHVLERQAGPERHRHPVAGHRRGVGGEAVERAAAARGDEQRLAGEQDRLAARRVDPDQPREAPLLDEDLVHEQLVVAREAAVLEQRVVQGLHLEEAGLVGGERRPRVGVAAERSLIDPAVGVPRPGDAPVVELPDLLRHLLDEAADDVLVGQEVGALDRVPGVQLEAVSLVGPEDRRGAALGADRVRAHQLHLGDDADVDLPGEAAGDLDRRAQAGQAGTEDQDVVMDPLHGDLAWRGEWGAPERSLGHRPGDLLTKKRRYPSLFAASARTSPSGENQASSTSR